jgi:hypothetical protein
LKALAEIEPRQRREQAVFRESVQGQQLTVLQTKLLNKKNKTHIKMFSKHHQHHIRHLELCGSAEQSSEGVLGDEIARGARSKLEPQRAKRRAARQLLHRAVADAVATLKRKIPKLSALKRD